MFYETFNPPLSPAANPVQCLQTINSLAVRPGIGLIEPNLPLLTPFLHKRKFCHLISSSQIAFVNSLTTPLTVHSITHNSLFLYRDEHLSRIKNYNLELIVDSRYKGSVKRKVEKNNSPRRHKFDNQSLPLERKALRMLEKAGSQEKLFFLE